MCRGGTANAIAVAFGISNNVRIATETILESTTIQVDVANCNGKPLMLLAGIGLEADVILQANRQLKDRIGTAAYILSAFQQVQDLDIFKVELETFDRVIQVEASGVTVANIAPATSVLAQGTPTVVPYDGLLDVTIFLRPQGQEARSQPLTTFFNLPLIDDLPIEKISATFVAKRLGLPPNPLKTLYLMAKLLAKRLWRLCVSLKG